jgi:hypothetical protein
LTSEEAFRADPARVATIPFSADCEAERDVMA